MFPISGLPPATAAARLRRPAAAGGGGFALPPDGTASASASFAAGTEDVSLAGMLGLQEADEAGLVGEREARRHGRDLLDALAALQRSLLGGSPDSASLSRLATLAAEIPPAVDPELQACLAQIQLRARVELVRYGFE